MIPLQTPRGSTDGFLQEGAWRASAAGRPLLTPEETRRETELFAFPSVRLTDSPSFYGGLL